MGHQTAFLAEFQELRQNLVDGSGIRHHGIIDSGEFRDPCRDWPPGVKEGAVMVFHFPSLDLHGADLNDLIVDRAESRGLYIKYHIGVPKALSLAV